MGIGYFGDAETRRILSKKPQQPISGGGSSLESPVKSGAEKANVPGQDTFQNPNEQGHKKLARSTALDIKNKILNMFARGSGEGRSSELSRELLIETLDRAEETATNDEGVELEPEDRTLARLEESKASYLAKIKKYEAQEKFDPTILDQMYANLRALNEKIYGIKGRKTGPREAMRKTEKTIVPAETITETEPVHEAVLTPTVNPIVVKNIPEIRKIDYGAQKLQDKITRIAGEDWRHKSQEYLELKKAEVQELLELNPNSEQANTLNDLSEELDGLIEEMQKPPKITSKPTREEVIGGKLDEAETKKSDDRRIRGVGMTQKKGVKNESNNWGEFRVGKKQKSNTPKTPDLVTGVVQPRREEKASAIERLQEIIRVAEAKLEANKIRMEEIINELEQIKNQG